MLTSFVDLYTLATKWSNDNQGVVSVGIFIITVAIGWASGIFSALRRRPKFRLSLIDGPTLCCTYLTGKVLNGFDVHRTGISLYLVVANVGSASSSIESISVGFHWSLRRFSVQWLRYSIGWFWLHNQVAALSDFHVKIGGKVKVYPFLTQKNHLSPGKASTFLEVGQSTNGVVYFEQQDSWGGCFPASRNGVVRVKVKVQDVFGREYTAKFIIPSVSLEEARKYNPEFGGTFAELRGEQLPAKRI